MATIFDYSDYRRFLVDFYTEKKLRNPSFSYRIIAKKVGFKSAGHFTKIIQGKANISLTLALRFAEFVKLNKRQSDYFQNLVLFNQAKNHSDQKSYFEKMLSFKEAAIMKLDERQYAFYDEWYYTAVREALAFLSIRDDYARLGAQLTPPIPAHKARKAVELLHGLGLIRRGEDGTWKQVDSLISCGAQTGSLSIDNFILNSLSLAREAIDRFKKEERLLAATAITVSPETYGKVIEEIRELRKKILNMACADQRPQRTYLLNFQIFPLSKPLTEGNNA